MDMEAASSGSSSSSKTPLGASSGSVSLAKPHFDGDMYSDMESNSSSNIVDEVLVNSNDKSFLGSAVITPKAKRVKNDLACGAPLGSLDYDMDDDDSGFLPPPLVAVKKSFALDINLSAVESKLAMAKTQVIRKLFSKINESMEKAVLLARENNIIVNSNLKRQRIHSDQAIVIKEIPIDMPKEMIVAAVSEFGEIKSIKIQLIGL
ncbi:hypothetical protein G9A89_020421 [Geosiphon pyriformis]|nr:hypothetical protein G9A89_020421 [Geosiphon pyriformis]